MLHRNSMNGQHLNDVLIFLPEALQSVFQLGFFAPGRPAVCTWSLLFGEYSHSLLQLVVPLYEMVTLFDQHWDVHIINSILALLLFFVAAWLLLQ